MYNGLHFNSRGLMRNVLNAWAYASFNAGAAIIVTGGSNFFSFVSPWTLLRTTPFVPGQSTLTNRTAFSVTVNALIILSTIHSQDFRDLDGDKRAGRWTIPMMWPKGSRISILVILIAWSVGLSWIFALAYHFSVPFCVSAVFIGLRFIQKKTADEDRRTFQYYTVRLV
jgi:4-hydroxybenzoate polyprenyltransferase